MRWTARRNAALLALRWHAGTGTLVALTAALTIAGAVPALSVLGGSTAAPSLTIALGDTGRLLADWNGRGVVWPQLQQLALLQLVGLVRGAVLLTLLVGAATLLALHIARTAARSGEVIVARSVGASRRDILGAMTLEAAALAGVALFSGMLLALVARVVMRAAWPGAMASADVVLSVAGTLGVTALVMVAPLLLVRALGTTRLVDDDRRPLTLIIPSLQLGAALVVLAGGVTLRDVTTLRARTMIDPALARTIVQDVGATDADRLQRARRFADFLATQHAQNPGTLVSLGSSGVHRGLGVSANATSDCGRLCREATIVRARTETVVHHAVSGDTFALAGLPLLQGRTLTDRDRWDSPLVAVISATLARSMFENGEAVGRRIQLGVLGNRWFEVVGVVGDQAVRGFGSEVQPKLGVYVSVLQHPVAEVEVASMQRAVRTDALRTIGTPRGAATSLLVRLGAEARALRWFTTLLLGMGIVTAIIAIGGLVAMLRLWLDSQQRELGVRRAVGATRRAIHRLVLGRALLVAVSGSLFGAWLGQIGWDVLPRIVPGAPAFDTVVVTCTAIALSALTLAVAWLMAWRFTRTPVGTLLLDVG
ncbi:MAG TPA: FtsX-like permease family protein [Gemmatimonadaceae bacterium]|nr:FtsX-like permease family protein [Gemmatimonadaceae bacterium]